VRAEEPPNKIRQFYYRCDRRFHEEALEGLFDTYNDRFGHVEVTGSLSTLSITDESLAETRVVGRVKARIQGKTRRGGQSAPRIGRLRQEFIQQYVKQVHEACNQHFAPGGLCGLDAILLTGPAEKKHQLYEAMKVDQRYKDTVIQVSEEVDFMSLSNELSIRNAKHVQKRILELLKTDPDLLSFGDEIDPAACATIYEEGVNMPIGTLQAYGGRIGIRYHVH